MIKPPVLDVLQKKRILIYQLIGSWIFYQEML